LAEEIKPQCYTRPHHEDSQLTQTMIYWY